MIMAILTGSARQDLIDNSGAVSKINFKVHTTPCSTWLSGNVRFSSFSFQYADIGPCVLDYSMGHLHCCCMLHHRTRCHSCRCKASFRRRRLFRPSGDSYISSRVGYLVPNA